MPYFVRRRFGARFDWTLCLTVVALATIGILNLRSASVMTESTAHVSQLVWFVVGGVLAALVAALDYRHFDRFAPAIYVFVVALLIYVLVLGVNAKGATRWIRVGSFTLQPSELAKISVILMLGRYFQHTRRSEGYSVRDLLPVFAIVGIPFALIFVEPDLGTSLVLGLIALTLILLERLQRHAIVAIIVILGVAGPLVFHFGLRGYQRSRVETWLHPEKYRFSKGWQARQAEIAVGSGQISGKGYMSSTQSFGRFLPETRTDFVLATYAEEHGLIGSVVLMGLYILLILWGVQIGYNARDRFGAVVAAGISALIFWHVLVNVGMVVGVLPVVGLTLPFLSYGGSSLLTVLLGMGLLSSISLRRYSHT